LLVNEEPVEEPGPEVPLITRVVISPDVDTLRVGDRLPLGVVAETAAGDPVSGQDVTWDVSPRDVARVEGAGAQVIVVAMSPGSVLVQATIGGVEGEATLEVIATVTALALLPAGRELELGESITLRVTDQDGGALDASFVSSDSSVAIVSGSGVLEGLASGEVRVVARAAGLVVEGVFTVIAAPDEVVAAGGQDDPTDPYSAFGAASLVDQVPRLLTDLAEIQRATDDQYPANLRGVITGNVTIRFYINASGDVRNSAAPAVARRHGAW